MSKFTAVVLAAAASMAIGGVAQAKAVTAKDPASVEKALKDGGYPAELDKDDSGDPMIGARADGTDFTVHFYGCQENRNCKRVQFMFSEPEPRNASLERLNEWNAENYFGRAYRTDAGGVRLEMDVDLDDGGMSPALFVDNVEWWSATLSSLQKHIRAEAPSEADVGEGKSVPTSPRAER